MFINCCSKNIFFILFSYQVLLFDLIFYLEPEFFNLLFVIEDFEGIYLM
jgi:hypothetical protein